MKELKQDTSDRVTMVRDKLLLNGSVVEPSFASNEIQLDCDLADNIKYKDIKQSEAKIINTNGVRGFYYNAEDLKEVKTVIAKIQCEPESRDASHMVYAYRLFDGETGHSDDREYGSSEPILQILERKRKFGVIVLCKYNGKKKLRAVDRDKEFGLIVNALIE